MQENNNPPANHLQPGMKLSGGKYTIEKKIGEGGFGLTYRAIQSGLNRAVCIKEYFPAGRSMRDTAHYTVYPQGIDEALFEKYRQAFRKEAETLASLQHPSIVEVIDIFDENNTSYMVMPFIEGRTLQQIVEQQGPIDYPQAVNYLAQVADAVGYIHQRNILHRDIKPDNIIITAEYRAILIDFGSAREFINDKTQAQTSIVTHGYAPTEQYSSNSRKGAYTDIYALGATFYFVLTGKVPLDAAARLTDEMDEPKKLNPSIPEEANRTILKAMQMKSADRHQSAQEFMDDLRNVHPSQQVEAAKPATATKTAIAPTPQESNNPSPKKSNTGLIIAISGLAVAIIIAAVLIITQNNTSEVTDTTKVEAIVEDVYTLDKKKLSDEELQQKSKRELELMRNEIYARHGYIFKRQDLQQYFNEKKWYHPITHSTYDIQLNSIEQYNVKKIKSYEK